MVWLIVVSALRVLAANFLPRSMQSKADILRCRLSRFRNRSFSPSLIRLVCVLNTVTRLGSRDVEMGY
jgi:hypothetical protein